MLDCIIPKGRTLFSETHEQRNNAFEKFLEFLVRLRVGYGMGFLALRSIRSGYILF